MPAQLANDIPRPSYAGRSLPGKNDEAWRLAVARVILDRKFRRDTLNDSSDPALAAPLEIGIDKLSLAQIAYKLETREGAYSAIFFVLLAAGAISLAATDGQDEQTTVVLIAFAVLAAAVGSFKNFRIHKILKSLYHPTADRISKLTRSNIIFPCVGPANQNVVVYRGFSPFDFAGTPLGGWSFAVDLWKKSEGCGSSGSPNRKVIEKRVHDEIHTSFGQQVESRELLLVHGLDVDILPRQRPNSQYLTPILYLNTEKMSEIEINNPKLARRYLLFSLNDWGGEIILSYILRFEIKDRILFVDHSRFILAPSVERHRPVGLQELNNWRYGWRQFVSGAGAGIFRTIFLPFQIFAHISEFFSGPDKIYRQAAKAGIPINYGSPLSTRRKMMGDQFTYYAQRHDLDVAIKSLEKITLEAIISTLEDFDIDVSELRNKQTTIFNSGILVQGGDVTAQALAVGGAASATTSNSSLRRRPPSKMYN